MQATFKPTVEFSVPPTNTQQPGTSSQAAPSARHTTATQEAISHVLSRVRSALNIDPPALPRPDPDAQLVAFDVQPHGLLHPTDPPVPHLLCACALADDTLAMYDLFEQRWSAHKLSNTQQKRVACVRWQPQSGSILAVSCARGVCIWRLAFSGDNELAGEHTQGSYTRPQSLTRRVGSLAALAHWPRWLSNTAPGARSHHARS